MPKKSNDQDQPNPSLFAEDLQSMADELVRLSLSTDSLRQQVAGRPAKTRTAKPPPTTPKRRKTPSDDLPYSEHNSIARRAPRVVSRHYDAHHINDGIRVPDPYVPKRENLRVYCWACKHTHPLVDVIYVIVPGAGLHFSCREKAQQMQWEEYVVR